MTFPELNVARYNASGVIMVEHLYVIGGRNEHGFVRQVERLNLKNINSKFEIIEVMLPNTGACDIGIVPLSSTNTFSEIMLIGGFNGQILSSRYRMTASVSASAFADNSQGSVATEHHLEEVLNQGEMKADFFSGQTMYSSEHRDDSNIITVLGATNKRHIFHD